MNVLILLTLLCLGMASAAPKVDHSLDAQSDLWMVNMVEDTINKAALERSPEALEKDNQEQSEEQQSIQTAVNASDYITLQMKLSRRIFDLIKGVTRKPVLGKVAKGFGKRILGEIVKPENVGDIVYGIGKQFLGGKKTQESLTTPNGDSETNEELYREDVLTPEPEHKKERVSLQTSPPLVIPGEEGHVTLQ